MTSVLGVGEAKKRLSELMSRVVYRGERFLIRRRGRPMAALVSADDLARLEQEPAAPRGLLAAVGVWGDFEELDEVVQEIYRQRERARDRAVALDR
jgi:prevent-host-death family protein